MIFFFFLKQKTAYDMRISDWSSDVCSSDLGPPDHRDPAGRGAVPRTAGRTPCHRPRSHAAVAQLRYGAIGNGAHLPGSMPESLAARHAGMAGNPPRARAGRLSPACSEPAADAA